MTMNSMDKNLEYVAKLMLTGKLIALNALS